MNRRLWLLLLAAVIVIALVLYPTMQCRVTEADFMISQVQTFVIPVQEGYAVGFSFNVTNRSSCEVNVQKIHVLLRSLTYPDGSQVAQNSEETESMVGTLKPNQSASFSHTFDSYFTYQPTKLLLRIEMTFAETGPVLVFDGDLAVSPVGD
jgi:hypothetical protein